VFGLWFCADKGGTKSKIKAASLHARLFIMVGL